MKFILPILLLGASLSSCTTQKTADGNSEGEVINSPIFHNGIYTTDRYADIETRTSSNDTIYVINFWATWCKPCVEELPFFLEYAQETKDENIKMIFVSLDFPHQVESKLLPFLQERNVTEEMWHMTNMDYNSWLDQVDPSWSGSIPATLVKKSSKRLFAEKSFDSAEELSDLVKQI